MKLQETPPMKLQGKTSKLMPFIALVLFLISILIIYFPLFINSKFSLLLQIKYQHHENTTNSTPPPHPAPISPTLPRHHKDGSANSSEKRSYVPHPDPISPTLPRHHKDGSANSSEKRSYIPHPDPISPTLPRHHKDGGADSSEKMSYIPQVQPNNSKHDATKYKKKPAKKHKTCNLFSGEWVPNPEGPYYTNDTCNAIQEHQNCMKFGRPDLGFLKWRWKPDECELPIFDPHAFLEMMRGKSLGFVGDSVARNQMQSLICLLTRVAQPVDASNTTDENKVYLYPAYNFNISIFFSPYLVRTERTDPNDPTRPYRLFLDEFDATWTTKIPKFDYLIISAGHWFARPTYFYLKRALVGCLYCPESKITHRPSSFSYVRAFRTALRAINGAVGFNGVAYLRTFAPSHFEGGPWDNGGDCVRTAPFRRNESRAENFVLEMYKIQLRELRIAQKARRRNGGRLRLFDATKPMLLRPDGHPSKYGHLQGANLGRPNDCVHWCLPGPLDALNDLLQELLKIEVKNNKAR